MTIFMVKTTINVNMYGLKVNKFQKKNNDSDVTDIL